ncbi:MAG: tetratricopeptide repeat protein [Pseudomonadota bacterium]
MSDIFQEVEEDLRREKLKRLWDRYGIVLISAAVLIVVITAGYRGYEAWSTSRERAAGDLFIAALQSADETGTRGAGDQLLAFAEGAPGGYPMLAKFRAASAYAAADDTAAARDVLTELSTDSSVPALYQDLARIRLAHTLIDLGETAEAEQTVAAMAEDTSNPFNKSAQEVMGLAAYAADNIAGAKRWFTSLRDAVAVPPALQARARFMLALMAQSSAEGAEPAAATAGETN